MERLTTTESGKAKDKNTDDRMTKARKTEGKTEFKSKGLQLDGDQLGLKGLKSFKVFQITGEWS